MRAVYVSIYLLASDFVIGSIEDRAARVLKTFMSMIRRQLTMAINKDAFSPVMQASISLLLFLSSCTSSSPASESTRPLAVRTIQVRTGPIRETLHYVGTIHSRNEIKVLARVVGKVANLPIKEGETARRGAAIAHIAAPEMDARVTRLHAEASRAQEESAFLCQQSETDRNLLASNAISKLKSDASRQKCESSRAVLKAAKAGLNELMVLAGNTVERAPFDGKVLQWLTEPGENLMPGRPILLFGDEQLEVRVAVHEKDVGAGIQTGTSVILFPDRPNPIRAKVSFVASVATGLGRMVGVRIPVMQTSVTGLQHGMSIDVSFVVREKLEAVLVPVNAVGKKKHGFGVYLVRDEIARWKSVTTSIREKGWIAVEADLKNGDRVVLGNLEAVRDGTAVYPVDSERVAK
jgi:RND family efflux transporter MFP subunit